MKKTILRKIDEVLSKLENKDLHTITHSVFPQFFLENVRKYLRIEVYGLENIPKTGRVLITPNHSNLIGLDAVMTAYILFKEMKRIPRILAHRGFFHWLPHKFTNFAHEMGLVEVSFEHGVELLEKNKMVLCFPEGERGNFKASSLRYRLQKFHTGFVRMAVHTNAPIIPCVIIGAEESNINITSLQIQKLIKGMLLPIPLNILPLPAKWNIFFLPPIDTSKFNPIDIYDRMKMKILSAQIRALIQKKIHEELRHRKYVYFPSGETAK